jgi:hypothetical protein
MDRGRLLYTTFLFFTPTKKVFLSVLRHQNRDLVFYFPYKTCSRKDREKLIKRKISFIGDVHFKATFYVKFFLNHYIYVNSNQFRLYAHSQN